MVIEFVDGSLIQCIGLDDSEKLKSIVGITSAFVEEATEISADDAQQLNLRIRGITRYYKQTIYAFNPISKSNWIYKRFFKDKYENTTLDHSTYKDNNFLDDEYVTELENLIKQNPAYYSIYTLGEWGVLENLIYNNYSIIDRFPYKDMEDVVYGVDFGYNHPAAMVKIGRKGGSFYVDEQIYKKKFTNTDLIKQIKINYPKDKPVYCDNAEPDRIEELKRDGINAKKAYKGKHSVKDGIDFIKSNKLYITKGSLNLLKEISGYTYKQDKSGVVYEEPVKFNDDLMDAMRYGIFTRWGKRREFGFIVA